MTLFIRSLSSALPDVRWEPPGKIHLTLKFLGDTEEDKLPHILEVIGEVAGRSRRFDVTIGGFGMFPPRGRPRVLWIGCHDPPGHLANLRSAVEAALVPLGFPPDDRPFHPHFTIGRVRAEGVANHLTSMAKNTTFDPHHANVREFFLMKSVLKPGGSVYSTLGSAQLS
jgi:2'-5' RNA ligase